MANLVEKEAHIIREIEDINFRLDRLYRQARAMRSQINRLDQEMAATKERHNFLVKEIQSLETFAKKRLVAFYKLSRIGVIPILFSDASLFETQRRINALEGILDQDAESWETLQSKKKRPRGSC